MREAAAAAALLLPPREDPLLCLWEQVPADSVLGGAPGTAQRGAILAAHLPAEAPGNSFHSFLSLVLEMWSVEFPKAFLYGSKSLQNVPKLPAPQQLNSVRGTSPEPQVAQSGKRMAADLKC